MSDAIIVAVISGCVTLAGILASFLANRNEFQKRSDIADLKLEAALDKNLAVMQTKLDTLTDEVREHNGFAQRIPSIETKLGDMDRRITNLEKK